MNDAVRSEIKIFGFDTAPRCWHTPRAPIFTSRRLGTREMGFDDRSGITRRKASVTEKQCCRLDSWVADYMYCAHVSPSPPLSIYYIYIKYGGVVPPLPLICGAPPTGPPPPCMRRTLQASPPIRSAPPQFAPAQALVARCPCPRGMQGHPLRSSCQ